MPAAGGGLLCSRIEAVGLSHSRLRESGNAPWGMGMRLRSKVIVGALIASSLLITAPTSLARQASPAPSKSGNLKSDPEAQIYQQLRSGDATQRQAAIDQLRRIVDAQPGQISRDIEKWIKPLSEAGFHKDVLRLTEEINVVKAADAAIMSDVQQARVRALLALGEKERALSEARSAFNVTPQKSVDRTIELLYEVLRDVRGEAVAEQFKHEQIEAMRPEAVPGLVLSGIAIDADRYRTALDRAGAGENFERLMARGNLLLMSDRTDAATEAFNHAAGARGLKGKRLSSALEGVARSLRAKLGGNGRANALVTAMKYGATDSSHVTAIEPLKLPMEQVQDAGRAITLARLPDSFEGSALAAGVTNAEPAIDRSGALSRAMEIVGSAEPPDPEIRAWLIRLSTSMYAPISDPTRRELAALLSKSPLLAESLFEFGRAFERATDDPATASLIYIAAAELVHRKFVELGPGPESVALVELLGKYRDDYNPVLWDRINSRADEAALNAARTLCEDFLTYCPATRPELRSARAHASLGLAHAYYRLGRYDEQLAVIAQADRGDLNEGMLRLLGYFKALALYEKGAYAAALPLLQDCAAWEGFRARQTAQRFVVLCLAKLDRAADARAELRRFVEGFEPAPPEIESLSREVEALLSQSSVRSANPGGAPTRPPRKESQ